MTTTRQINLLLLSFIFSPNVGGVETHLTELCDYLTTHNVRVIVITYMPIIGKMKAPFKEIEENLIIYRIPWIRGNLFNKLISHPIFQMLYLIPAILFFSMGYLLMNRRKIDIIQTHGFNMAVAGYLLAKVFQKPFTVNTHVTFHFTKKSLYSTVLGHILQRAKEVLVLTDEAKKEVVKLGVQEQNITTYHYWVDKQFHPFPKPQMRKELGVSEKNFLVLFVGRFIPEKGVLHLLDAVKRVGRDIQLVLIGSGPLEQEIEKLAEGIPHVTIITGIKRTELPKWYSVADITIIPSYNATSTYAEGIPRVMIESFSCGTPVIATKAGGLKTMLRKDVGFFITPSVNSIQKILTELSEKRKELFIMRTSCIRYAANVFNMEMNAKKILKSLYD